MAESRAAESSHQRDSRLEEQRQRTAESRAAETSLQRETRLEDNRLRIVESRAAETSDQRDSRLEGQRRRAAESRIVETPEQRETRLEDNRLRMEESRAAETPEQRENRLQNERVQRQNSRQAFSFMPTFKVKGQIYHRLGSLLPLPNENHKFLQIYFMGDEQQQVNQRCGNTDGTRRNIVLNLQRMFHQHNNLVKMFKTALERMPTDEYRIVIRADKRPPGEHERRFNAPTVDEVAVIMVGDEFDRRDIIIQKRNDSLQRISETHRHMTLFSTQ
ncbi:hypothetical protein ANCCAN_08899 [Ancylostoma caninum]|uniref:Helitron helicase-like domain-containing protein n=1 Tax=Ancylostoma caninum TaxID=29170 RepID=A0A368GP80_ANCCA|nr:hypothetical protein ANCCAN_08899 [Ancylostoma caninum]